MPGLERGDRGGLRHPVHAERDVHLHQRGDHLGVAHRVTDAQPGQAVCLRERAQDNHIRSVAADLHPVRTILRGQPHVLVVGLVEHHEHVRGHGVEEALERRPAVRGAGGVVGVADEDQPGVLGDRRGQRVQVVRVVRGQRHLHGGGVAHLRDDRVRLERAPREQHLVPRRRAGDLHQFLAQRHAAAADRDVLDPHPEELGQRRAQLARLVVRVAVRQLRRLGDRLGRGGQRRQRGLVARQLHRAGVAAARGVGGDRGEVGTDASAHGFHPSWPGKAAGPAPVLYRKSCG
ncbi:hypothetical protein CJ468_05365 [Nocardia farcinica]|nr:hypothetical protein CJ468_05365 [Nocardia farcinica]